MRITLPPRSRRNRSRLIRSFIFAYLAIAALLELTLLSSPTMASEGLVQFRSAAPSARQAEAPQDDVSLSHQAPAIEGYLTRPEGRGPFPAVILLHSCLGLRADRQSIAGTVARWGYVALFVDDFTTRGIKETCTVDFPEGLADAFGALAFTASLPYVDKTRIAAVGYSQGADTALKIASSPMASAFAIPGELQFTATAAFYPPCQNQLSVRLQLPTLILIGAADMVTPAAACRQLVRSQSAAKVKLIVYPGAGHVFDDPEFKGGRQVMGMWLQFDQPAAGLSRAALRAFLAAAFGR